MLSIKLFISYTKCTFQVSLASELMCNYLSRDVTASFGYDYILRQVAFFLSCIQSQCETNTTCEHVDRLTLCSSILVMIELFYSSIWVLWSETSRSGEWSEIWQFINLCITSRYIFGFHSSLTVLLNLNTDIITPRDLQTSEFSFILDVCVLHVCALHSPMIGLGGRKYHWNTWSVGSALNVTFHVIIFLIFLDFP